MAVTKQQTLDYHFGERPGKIEVIPSKPCRTQRDLSLAYTPGVAIPCLEIEKNPRDAFKYTARGNPGRRDQQRHGGARSGRYWRTGWKASDGRQGRSVQAFR